MTIDKQLNTVNQLLPMFFVSEADNHPVMTIFYCHGNAMGRVLIWLGHLNSGDYRYMKWSNTQFLLDRIKLLPQQGYMCMPRKSVPVGHIYTYR